MPKICFLWSIMLTQLTAKKLREIYASNGAQRYLIYLFFQIRDFTFHCRPTFFCNWPKTKRGREMAVVVAAAEEEKQEGCLCYFAAFLCLCRQDARMQVQIEVSEMCDDVQMATRLKQL